MSWHAALLALAFLSLTEIGGCALLRRGSGSEDVERETTVEVDNHHLSNINVYLLRDGARTHLGMVTSQMQATFQVPHTLLVDDFVDLQVVADAVGGRAFVSEQVRVWRGDEIMLHVANRLQKSWIMVRPH